MGVLYDPVADKDVIWLGGGKGNSGDPVGKTLYLRPQSRYLCVG
jgi:hypothetical protein